MDNKNNYSTAPELVAQRLSGSLYFRVPLSTENETPTENFERKQVKRRQAA